MTSPDRIIRVVAVQTPDINQQLQWTGFRRLNLRVEWAVSAQEVLDHLAAQKPDFIILDTAIEGGDVFDLCRKIKVERNFGDLPVLVHTEGAISRDLHQKIIDSRCDELLIGSYVRGQIYETIAPHLKIPVRSEHRVQVTAQVNINAPGKELSGRVFDLTVNGARLILSGVPSNKESISLTIRPQGHNPVTLDGRVVWFSERGKDAEVAVQFTNVATDISLRLLQITSWELTTQTGRQLVRVLRGLTDRTTLDGLGEKLTGEVDFDLSNVLTVTSVGVSRWVQFLRQLSPQVKYRLLGCSTVFCAQASYVRDMIGKSRVISLFAPYYSSQYDYEAERELFVTDLGETYPPEPPDFPCPLGGMMSFDDLPERYFSFLDPSAR